MNRPTTYAAVNNPTSEVINGRRHFFADVSFECCGCRKRVEWKHHEFRDALEYGLAAATPAYWTCEDCQATDDEIFANRNAGI